MCDARMLPRPGAHTLHAAAAPCASPPAPVQPLRRPCALPPAAVCPPHTRLHNSASRLGFRGSRCGGHVALIGPAAGGGTAGIGAVFRRAEEGKCWISRAGGEDGSPRPLLAGEPPEASGRHKTDPLPLQRSRSETCEHPDAQGCSGLEVGEGPTDGPACWIGTVGSSSAWVRLDVCSQVLLGGACWERQGLQDAGLD